MLSLIGGKRAAIQYLTHFHILWLKKPNEKEAEFDSEAQDVGAGIFFVLRDALIRLSHPEGPT